jgi:pectin methylesterase-like acyl-CoA thioesterase
MVYVTSASTGCSFRNITMKNNWTVAQNLYGLKAWGINTYFENCDIENLGSAHLTNAVSASLSLGGNENIFKNSTIGQNTLLTTSTAGQQILIENRGTTATKATRNIFENCRVQSYTSDTTHVFVRAGANSIDRDCHFDNCTFANTIGATSAVTLAVAFATDAAVGGGILVSYPKAFGVTNIATVAVGNTGMLLAAPVNAASDATAVTPT